MFNLHDLPKTDSPFRFLEVDWKMLQDELNNIGGKTVEDIRKNKKRATILQAVFSFMVMLLVLLSVFFASVICVNQKLNHSDILIELAVIHSILIILILAAIAFIYYRQKH